LGEEEFYPVSVCDGTALEAEDVEEFIPKGFGFGPFAGLAAPVA
jgi:hypothetical protein